MSEIETYKDLLKRQFRISNEPSVDAIARIALITQTATRPETEQQAAIREFRALQRIASPKEELSLAFRR
jgi:hypothetical protein